MKPPTSISYSDIIHTVENRLRWMRKTYPALVNQGSKSQYSATREIETYSVLLKLLQAHKKGRQLNLNDLFEQLKNT